MYEDVSTKVRFNGRESRAFNINVGVHQGSVLNLLLFIIVLEALSREFREGLPMDDLVLIAETKELLLIITQFVKSPTRHDSSLLDLIITPSSSKLVTVTSVISSHEISDHDLTLPNLNTKRYKSPQRTYHYRNIKGINLELFEQSILSSSLF